MPSTSNPTVNQSITNKVAAFALAYTRGSSAGEIETTIGNIFHGAFKSARLAGYSRDVNESAFRMYVQGYLSEMPYGVTLDSLDRVLAIRTR